MIQTWNQWRDLIPPSLTHLRLERRDNDWSTIADICPSMCSCQTTVLTVGWLWMEEMSLQGLVIKAIGGHIKSQSQFPWLILWVQQPLIQFKCLTEISDTAVACSGEHLHLSCKLYPDRTAQLWHFHALNGPQTKVLASFRISIFIFTSLSTYILDCSPVQCSELWIQWWMNIKEKTETIWSNQVYTHLYIYVNIQILSKKWMKMEQCSFTVSCMDLFTKMFKIASNCEWLMIHFSPVKWIQTYSTVWTNHCQHSSTPIW